MSQLNSLALSMASFQRKGKWSWNSRFDRIGLANCGTICMEEQPKGLEIEAAFSCMFKKWWTSKSARPGFCTSDWIPISSKNSPGKFSCLCYIQRFNFWPFRKELLNHTHHHRLSRRGITCGLSSGQFWLQAAIAMEESVSWQVTTKTRTLLPPAPSQKKAKPPPTWR